MRASLVTSMLSTLSLLLTMAIAAAAWADAIPPTPIPQGSPAPTFTGTPGKGKHVSASKVPRHPFMAPNGRSNIHGDAFMTDTYTTKGPSGKSMQVQSMYITGGGVCGSLTFDNKGRIIATCITTGQPFLELLDPKTLDKLASLPLPPRPMSSNPFQDFTGGGYFYLDNHNRAVLFTADHHISIVAVTGTKAAPAFTKMQDWDLTSVIPDDDKATSLLPDWSGRIWFVTFNGIVGTLDPTTGTVQTLPLGEEIENSFAVDNTGGVFIVSNAAQYRFDADANGAPSVTWREVYENSGIRKPGQVDAGSGTTPTLVGTDYVAITDNADPMNVVVYRRGANVPGSRLVCEQPVFSAGAGCTENSLIGAGNALIVENNYGYTGPPAASNGATTAPGIWRVDINADASGCSVVWQSNERAPSVVPKLSLSTGLIYTYTKDPETSGTPVDPWYFTAIDFKTGVTRWKQLAGTGPYFNNNYAPVTLGSDGSAYVGVLGGLVKLKDGKK